MRVEGTGQLPEVQRSNVSGAGKAQSNRLNESNEKKGRAEISTKDYIREDFLSKKEREADREALRGDLDVLNETMRTYDRGLNFVLHEDSNDYYVQVVDLIEDEIVREIPPEQILDLVAKIDEMIGLVIDERI